MSALSEDLDFLKLEERLNTEIKDEFSEFMRNKNAYFKKKVNMDDVIGRLDSHFENKFVVSVSGS